MLEDPDSGIDLAKVRLFLDTEFEFPGGKMKLNDDRAPRGAKGLLQRLTDAATSMMTKKLHKIRNRTAKNESMGRNNSR